MHIAPQEHILAPDKYGWISVSLAAQLVTGELLTNTATAVEQDTSNLTIDNIGRNTEQVTLNNKIVEIDQAIQFRVKGTIKGVYYILVSCPTNATPTRDAWTYIKVIIADSSISD